MNLGQVNLFVEDFPAMLRFYRDQLGCVVSDLDPGPPAEPLVNWAQVIVGNMILRADTREALELCFIVDDVETERSRLEQAGIACEPVIAEEWGRFSYFRDPEGNRLQIFEVAAKT